ncbi:MAG: hypothetical protein B6D59_00680 [Campylobacteraceae bacterium 4484_4]|nr:MAG: hypothetical protein B6D59_00680 [Campylobacteraceae bacterium 4484_4]
MKSFFLFSLVAITLHAYTIEFDKTFQTKILPDTLQASISVQVKQTDEKSVIDTLTRYSKFIRNFPDVVKKGGNFNVYPEYNYEHNRRYKTGYSGTISYQIESQDPKKIDAFLEKLQALKRSKTEDINIASVSWIMSEKQLQGKMDKLRLETLLWINNYTKSLSKSLDTSCIIKDVSFIPKHYPTPYPTRTMPIDKAAFAPTPQQNPQMIQLHPTFQLECK